MKRAARHLVGGTIAALTALAGSFVVWWWLSGPAGRLVQIPEFGVNPTGLEMHLYLPPRVSPQPAVVLALHWCQGSGPDFHANTRFSQLADKHGYIVIYPSATRESRCWDVHSAAALTHNGGSDPIGLLSMLQFVVEHQAADRGRLFVTGHSSGGMMTQQLLGAYPEVFRAGAALASIPFGCFAGPTEWNEACALGRITRSPEEWAELVQRAYPTFSGTRPTLQLWHGTRDDGVSFHNFDESIKQWTHLLGTSATPVSTDPDTPGRPWMRLRYANANGEVRLEAFRGEGEPHNFQVQADEIIRFFGIGS